MIVQYPDLEVDQSGVYWVSVTDNGCSYTDTIIVAVNLTPSFDLGNDTTLCALPYLLDPFGSFQNYLWSDGSTGQSLSVGSPGTYWLTASNGNCSFSDTIVIETFGISVVLVPDTTFCGVVDLLLTTNSIGNHVWSDNSTGNTLHVTQSGTYWVTVSTSSCVETDTIIVYQSAVDAEFSAVGGVSCGPMDVIFTDLSTASNGAIMSWSWDFDDGSSSLLHTPVHTFNGTGNCYVQLTLMDSHGCLDDTVVQVDGTINQPATAAFNYSPSTVLTEQGVYFNNLSENATGWLWDFGDGNVSNEFEPVYQYSVGGSYDVTLIAYGPFGCNDTITITISVVDEILIYVPNAFTPDGDEINNIWQFYISGISEADYSVEVFNRWGEIIWESSDVNESWDGTYKGRLVQTGVYTWKIQCQALVNDESREYVGHVNVLY